MTGANIPGDDPDDDETLHVSKIVSSLAYIHMRQILLTNDSDCTENRDSLVSQGELARRQTYKAQEQSTVCHCAAI